MDPRKPNEGPSKRQQEKAPRTPSPVARAPESSGNNAPAASQQQGEGSTSRPPPPPSTPEDPFAGYPFWGRRPPKRTSPPSPNLWLMPGETEYEHVPTPGLHIPRREDIVRHWAEFRPRPEDTREHQTLMRRRAAAARLAREEAEAEAREEEARKKKDEGEDGETAQESGGW